jgi:hypothetical protein
VGRAHPPRRAALRDAAASAAASAAATAGGDRIRDVLVIAEVREPFPFLASFLPHDANGAFARVVAR